MLAMTRAGKGQTVIEATIDMWSRERKKNNMVINDPKGELLVKNYVRLAVRGFHIVQFNLINAMKTDIYNPLGMAADSAREGDFTKSATYVQNIGSVFFPVEGSDDPVWPNAARNAFMRAAYGLMDFYLESEEEMMLRADKIGQDKKTLERNIDRMWGKMTLYNCYQMFVNLTAKKKKNPWLKFVKLRDEASKIIQEVTAYNQSRKPDEPEMKAASPNPEIQYLFTLSDEEYKNYEAKMERLGAIWNDEPEADLLTLYFGATALLPRNQMRVLVNNAHNALAAMGGADKMMASVYGIAITAMSFFVDPTIATLTSGTPSQNVDLAGLSFPRRLGVRFHNDYLKKHHLITQQVRWSAYRDPNFTDCLGEKFEHVDSINREGWARYYFEGIFPNEKTYLKMEIRNPMTEQLTGEMFFMFEKTYQTSFDAKFFVKDPVLQERIVKNGILTELKAKIDEVTGEVTYVSGKTKFKRTKINFNSDNLAPVTADSNAIIRFMTRYSEKPKAVFLVTPPHLMDYAKLLLILLKQLVDLNFDQSYMTKSNQKPLCKTRFMLEELGNLQSDGHGISGFQTMLSIGLGQEQQFSATSCVVKSYAA